MGLNNIALITIIILFELIFLWILFSEVFSFLFKKIENIWIKIAIKKIKFILKNNLHPHFLIKEAILSIAINTKKTNKKIILKILFSSPYFIFVFIFIIKINDFQGHFSQIIQLIFFSIWAIVSIFFLLFTFFRYIKIKQMLNIKRKIIFQKDAKLFDIHLSRKLLEQINHTGSVENIEITFSSMEEIYENRDIRFLLFELKPKSLFKNKKQNILLNRDIIYYKLNGNKEQARHIHYLMVVYSNYKDEEFYNPNYENNMRYFLELEKYHSNDKNKL